MAKAKKINKRRRKRIFGKVCMMMCIVVGLIWYGCQYMHLEERSKAKEKELQELKEELQEKKKELNKKNMEVNYYQSDENIEKIARDELGLVKPQEIVIIQSN